MNLKYEKADKALWAEYDARCDEIKNHIEERVSELNKELLDFIKERGMHDECNGDNIVRCSTYRLYGPVGNTEERLKLQKQSDELREKRDNAIWNIVMSLELGEAGKDDLQTLLSGVSFD